jgi:cyclopropane fatty-acyl-phospholipid synthase-like methyltransferase
MATRRFPERLVWVVSTLAVEPGDHLLEIGCGRGAAVSLICEALEDGSITALDRSAMAIRAAEQANSNHVRAGKASFLHAELATVELDQRFDKVFAVNVNLFWVGTATRELAIIERLLTPDGALHLFYGYGKPGTGRSDVVEKLTAGLTAAGYAVDAVVEPSPGSSHMLYIRARPRHT